MSNAALYLHPNGYDTSGPQLLGRISAGESFLRGYLRHAEVDRYYFWNIAGRPEKELNELLERVQAPAKPVTWIGQTNRGALGGVGVLNMPVPGLTSEAWLRRPFGPRAYAICGITHTTATDRVMQAMAEMLIAPTEDYDALICTSNAVRHSIDTQMGAMRDYLMGEYGARKRPEPMRVTIPLGVNVEDFATSPEHRKAWRERLDIPQDAVVALFMGRFNVRAKMNPALMAIALERAAKATGKPIYWVNAGWSPSAKDEETYHAQTRELCPTVHYRSVDGRPPDVRFTIWSVADFFISFSDNIQETFGLTPIEAMAAGLPCVVTDWDGYKDTVRHGEDGFRIPTVAPPPGEGGDLAFWFANAWLNYDNYVGAAGQFTAIDYAEAEAAITTLVLNPDERRRMGENAKARAREVFDWAAIIPQYQALWAEQNARRLAAPPAPATRENPYKPDPFTLFQSYPTRHLSARTPLTLGPGVTWEMAEPLLRHALVNYSNFHRPTPEESRQMLALIAERPGVTVGEVAQAAGPARRAFVGRGVLWLARYGLITIGAEG
ncbi:glycosyltransferase family 4 protein [Phenylobacterium sp.]|uniref:glycosyltransferase family 4 protein n=1 Tax=Phenylobacterium sp. TaxID=1871053 RepID=UPI002DE4B8E7|nr:glycosyltransferase family 4 protein [Phenylobacterium sp.]